MSFDLKALKTPNLALGRDCHIYLHIDGALYVQKSVPSWFLAVFDSKPDKYAKIWRKKSCQFFETLKFQLITVADVFFS